MKCKTRRLVPSKTTVPWSTLFVESGPILGPLNIVADSKVLRIVNPAIDMVQKFITHDYLHNEANPTSNATKAKLLLNLIKSMCKCHYLGGNAMELLLIEF